MFADSIPVSILYAPPARTFVEDYLKPHRPVVIRGAIDDWPALAKWSPAWFKRRFGSVRVETYAVQEGELVFDPHRGLVEDKILLSEFLDELSAGRPATRRIRSRILEVLPELMNDLTVPIYCRDTLKLEPNLWFSAPHTFSRLHFDQPQNLLVQVLGRKQVVLFPPSQSRLLYPHPPFSPVAQFSQIDLRAPDFARFPRLKKAKPLQATLSPGEMLFIPGGFWHYIESPETTVSVGFRWWPWKRLPLLLAAEVYKRLRGHSR